MKKNDQLIINFIKEFDEEELLISCYTETIFKNLSEAKKEMMALSIKRLECNDVLEEEEKAICNNLEQLYKAVVELQSAYVAKDLGLDNIEAGVNSKGEIYLIAKKETRVYSLTAQK
jgi:hypothetical protein